MQKEDFDFEKSNEHETQKLCSVHRPISLNKLLIKPFAKMSSFYSEVLCFLLFTFSSFSTLHMNSNLHHDFYTYTIFITIHNLRMISLNQKNLTKLLN